MATKPKATASQKRGRGRPVELSMPEPIPDTPENIARACMVAPPKRSWDYMRGHGPGRRSAKPRRG